MDSLTEEQETMWDILSTEPTYEWDENRQPKAGDVYFDMATGKSYTFGGILWYED